MILEGVILKGSCSELFLFGGHKGTLKIILDINIIRSIPDASETKMHGHFLYKDRSIFLEESFIYERSESTFM